MKALRTDHLHSGARAVMLRGVRQCDHVRRGSARHSPHGIAFLHEHYRVTFATPFEATDHTASIWGRLIRPNVLAWDSSGQDLSFAQDQLRLLTASRADWDQVHLWRLFQHRHRG